MICSKWTYDYDDDLPNWKKLCRCPICKGFLPQSFPLNKSFTCKKCGTDLLTFPEYNEEGIEIKWGGKICPISTPKGVNE
jgi:hypothetical protein